MKVLDAVNPYQIHHSHSWANKPTKQLTYNTYIKREKSFRFPG